MAASPSTEAGGSPTTQRGRDASQSLGSGWGCALDSGHLAHQGTLSARRTCGASGASRLGRGGPPWGGLLSPAHTPPPTPSSCPRCRHGRLRHVPPFGFWWRKNDSEKTHVSATLENTHGGPGLCRVVSGRGGAGGPGGDEPTEARAQGPFCRSRRSSPWGKAANADLMFIKLITESGKLSVTFPCRMH